MAGSGHGTTPPPPPDADATAAPAGQAGPQPARRRGRHPARGAEHLATDGAAALSLRAVARDLGMVSSGIYRYVESRDELLTRLIVDSYWSLAAAVRTAHDATPVDDLEGRWDAIGRALRAWAVGHPHDFALIYGSPVPDYEAPAERTEEPGTAVLVLLVALLDDVRRAGRLTAPDRLGLVAVHAEAGVGALLEAPMFAATEPRRRHPDPGDGRLDPPPRRRDERGLRPARAGPGRRRRSSSASWPRRDGASSRPPVTSRHPRHGPDGPRPHGIRPHSSTELSTPVCTA